MGLALGTKSTKYNIYISWNAKSIGVKSTGSAILGVLISLGCYNHRLCGLHNRLLFLTALEAGKSEISMFWVWYGPSSLLAVINLLVVFSHRREKEALVSLPLLKRALIPSWGLHLHDFI